MANPSCLAFKMRSLFGVNVRADALTCLLVRGKGHPSGISRLLAVSQKQVQDTLVETARSGLVHVRPVGRRKDYWVEPDKWYPFLFGQEVSPVQWVHWRALTRGLSILWALMSKPSLNADSDYVISSMARRAIRSAKDDLLDSGIGIKLTDDRPHRAEAYLDVFIKDVRGVVDRLQV